MNIDIYTSCCVVGQKDNKRTGCAIAMFATVQDGRCLRRQFTYGFGQTTINLAGLQAIRLAILSLRPWVAKRPSPVVLTIDNRYASDILSLDDGSFKIDPKVNMDVVKIVRDLYCSMPDMAVNYHKFDSGIGVRCQALARDAAECQAMSDSGTMEFQDVIKAGLQEEN